MGLWGGTNNDSIEEQEMSLAVKIANRERTKAMLKSGVDKTGKAIVSGAIKTGKAGKWVQQRSARAMSGAINEAGQAYGVATQQQVNFSPEQRMLGELFGQGEKIWGTNKEPVRINNDLNSSRSDPYDETGSMFGFGDFKEKSGLF